jgi:hypothetical protein
MMNADEDFKIIQIRKGDVERGQGLRALAEVRIGQITIRSIRIIQEDGQEPFCALPREPYFHNRLGKILRRAVVVIPAELKSRIYGAILEEWSRTEKLKFNGGGGEINDQG